ncbi:MAG: hypothetical protein HY064_09555 [Bacteroidetes bacterium]|nr:hypothetical protein [Bacteroidota bacterium]
MKFIFPGIFFCIFSLVLNFHLHAQETKKDSSGTNIPFSYDVVFRMKSKPEKLYAIYNGDAVSFIRYKGEGEEGIFLGMKGDSLCIQHLSKKDYDWYTNLDTTGLKIIPDTVYVSLNGIYHIVTERPEEYDEGSCAHSNHSSHSSPGISGAAIAGGAMVFTAFVFMDVALHECARVKILDMRDWELVELY